MSSDATPSEAAPTWGRLGLPLLASLSLGLAPFTPEPHLVGKLRWVAGGARGMGLVDWGDLLLHGAPWVWLGATLLGRGWMVVRSPARLEAEPPPVEDP